MRKLFFIVVFLNIQYSIFNCQLFSQDAQFSQYFNAPLQMNPALTGKFDGSFRIANNYKNQWESFDNAGNTVASSFDMNFFKDNTEKDYIGAGIFFYNDKFGEVELGNTQAGISFAYHTKNLEKKQSFSFGLQGGYGQRSINTSKLTWDNQFLGDTYRPDLSSGENPVQPSVNYADFSSGALWQYFPSEKFNLYSGMSLYHLNRPNISFLNNQTDKLDTRFSFHSGAAIGFGKTFLLPQAMLLKQGASHQYIFGMLVKQVLQKKSEINSEIAFSLGAFYRLSAAVFVAQIDYRNFIFGISYDANVSYFKSSFGGKGGPEVSLSYIHQKKNRNNQPQMQ